MIFLFFRAWSGLGLGARFVRPFVVTCCSNKTYSPEDSGYGLAKFVCIHRFRPFAFFFLASRLVPPAATGPSFPHSAPNRFCRFFFFPPSRPCFNAQLPTDGPPRRALLSLPGNVVSTLLSWGGQSGCVRFWDKALRYSASQTLILLRPFSVGVIHNRNMFPSRHGFPHF